MTAANYNRLHELDALRGGALILGIFFHAAFSFFPGDQFWIIVDTQRSTTIAGIAFVLHIFRMTVFFLLAGYFARMQVYRLRTGSFVRDRLKRIGIPLVAFWPLIMACFIGLGIWSIMIANGGAMPENPPPPPAMTTATFPLTHLWFLYALILLITAMVAGRKVLELLKLKPILAKFSDSALGWLLPIGILPLVLALPTALAFIFQPNWHPFFGIPAPDYGFLPNRVAVIAYGGAFMIGWLLQRSPDYLKQAAKPWPIYLVGAIGLTVYCMFTVGLNVTYIQPLPKYAMNLYPIAYAVAAWLWTFGLIGLCMVFWSKENRVRRYIADASYWLYIIHLPIVMALQIWMSGWSLAAEIKFTLILGISIPLMLISYEFLVRYTFIGAILNGKKRTRQTLEIAKDAI
jgi:peptidoglycan/LPS O-acetylase OafA/YrhL